MESAQSCLKKSMKIFSDYVHIWADLGPGWKGLWGGRREEGSGWGTHVYLWWIHFDIWQN